MPRDPGVATSWNYQAPSEQRTVETRLVCVCVAGRPELGHDEEANSQTNPDSHGK